MGKVDRSGRTTIVCNGAWEMAIPSVMGNRIDHIQYGSRRYPAGLAKSAYGRKAGDMRHELYKRDHGIGRASFETVDAEKELLSGHRAV
jgi:hypothetical protein